MIGILRLASPGTLFHVSAANLSGEGEETRVQAVPVELELTNPSLKSSGFARLEQGNRETSYIYELQKLCRCQNLVAA